MSVLLTVASLIFVAMLPGQQAGDVNYKSQSTSQKLEKVETVLTGFMALNGRLPCPATSLGLDDSYAFDDWGRRVTYVVDRRATGWSSCLALESNPVYLYQHNGTGGILIKSSTTGAAIDNTMHAFISHGPDGEGAFPDQGSGVAGRINAGSTDTDELTNAGVDANFSYNTTIFTNVKVMKDRTSTFGDVVYYAQYQKNTCCVGPYNCSIPGFRRMA